MINKAKHILFSIYKQDKKETNQNFFFFFGGGRYTVPAVYYPKPDEQQNWKLMQNITQTHTHRITPSFNNICLLSPPTAPGFF